MLAPVLTLAALIAGGAAPAQARTAEADPGATTAAVVTLTNRFRGDHDRSPLAVNDRLTNAAQRFAEFMAGSDAYGHDADGRAPADRARTAGYDYCMVAENLAYQFSSAGFASADLARRLLDGWAQSPGHRENMLQPQALDIGVGIAQSPRSGRWYAVQMFGRPRSASSRFEIVNRSDAVVRYEVDGKSLTLEPRVARTHQGCFSGDLQLTGPDGVAPAAVQPRDGARYVVQRDASGRLRLQAAQP